MKQDLKNIAQMEDKSGIIAITRANKTNTNLHNVYLYVTQKYENKIIKT